MTKDERREKFLLQHPAHYSITRLKRERTGNWKRWMQLTIADIDWRRNARATVLIGGDSHVPNQSALRGMSQGRARLQMPR